MKKQLLIFSLLFGGLSAPVISQSDSTRSMVMAPIQTDRPDQTESAYLVPKGYFQVELGFSVEDTDPGFIYSYPSALVKFGVTDNFELRLIAEYITIQKEPNPDLNGFLPLAFGIKTRLTEEKGILPKISFLGHLTLPGVVAEDFETTYFAPDVRFAFQHTISDMFSVGYNLGAAWDGENAEPNIFYSLSAGVAITNQLVLYVEGFGNTPQREEGDMELRADAGLTYLIGNDFLLDVSAGKGITDNAPESYAAVGFSYRFKL